jgi:hypothetical protein
MGSNQSSPNAVGTSRDVNPEQRAKPPIDFDKFLLPRIRPRLGPAADFGLSSDQVIEIFGINPDNFTPIPSRLVVPVLKGRRESGGSFRTRGWLYILEPQEWLPIVRHGDSVTVSEFATPQSKMRSLGVAESKFNSGCKASISFENDGSFYGTRPGVRQTINAAFEYSDTSVTKAQLRRDGVAHDTLVQELLLYPTLRCRGIKRQRIDYTVNVASKSLEWATKPSNADGMERVRVRASRLAGRIGSKLSLHPVPVHGSESEDEARLLAVPKMAPDGEMQIMTLLSRIDWPDWYIYEAELQEWTKTIDLAAAQNDVAVRPTSCWTTLLDEFLEEGSDMSESVSSDEESERDGRKKAGVGSSGRGPRKLTRKKTSKLGSGRGRGRGGDTGQPRVRGIMVAECPF